MGADLYIESVFQRNREHNDPLFHAAVRLRDWASAGYPYEQHDARLADARTLLESAPEELHAVATELYTSVLYGKPYSSDNAQQLVEHFCDAIFSEGYFRDSYNATNVAWVIGFSWWGDVIPRLDESGNLWPPDIEWLLNTAKYSELNLPDSETLKERLAADADTPEGVAAWHAHFREKRDELVAFLEQALKLGEPIYCSL